ncbi:hypothetical protein [Halocola ammonii]
MKNIHTHFKLFLLFGVFAAFSSCKKDQPYDPSESMDNYFEGKVNGVQFEPDGNGVLSWMNGAYYPNGYLDFERRYFHVSIRNVEDGEFIVIGTRANLHEGVFTSCNENDSVGPRGHYMNNSIDIPDSNESILHATECQEIRLEIIRIVETSDNNGYIEGALDATVRDSELDTTIVISDVKFGYKF